MAEDWQVNQAKRLILWQYDDSEPVRQALTAGDTEGDDREGHRPLARLGDSIVPLIIATICNRSRVPRCKPLLDENDSVPAPVTYPLTYR